MNTRPVCLSAAFTAGLFLSGFASANLIQNGGFEDPTINSPLGQEFTPGQYIGAWLVVGDSSAGVIITPTNYSETSHGMNQFEAEEGLQSLDLPGSYNQGTTSGVSQSIATVVGATYQVSFYLGAADSNNNNNYYSTAPAVDLSFDGGVTRAHFVNPDLTSSPGYISWEQFQTSFVATGTTTNITFYDGTSPWTCCEAGLDNVVVLGPTTPEPFTMVLGAAGLGLALARRRKANKA